MTNNATPNERQTVLLVQGGDPTAMKALYCRHVRYLTAVCSRYIAGDDNVKDVMQESFLRIFASVGRFEYRGEGSLRAWMTRIVVNESLKFIRSSGRLDLVELTQEQLKTADEEPAADDIPAAALHDMVRSLPTGYRTIFNLYVMEEKSHKEIAAMLDISESTSASQLHRAKALLAEKIKRYRTANSPSR